jgi:hypothetical protein
VKIVVAGFLFMLVTLGFVPRFSFLHEIIDPSMFMGGVVWYILFTGCLWRGSLSKDTLSKEAASSCFAVAPEEPISCCVGTQEELEETDEDYMQESMLEDPNYCCMEPSPSEGQDEENSLQHNAGEALPTQAEFDWITSARSGELNLTEDVFCAAVQWWLEQQHDDRFDWLSPGDQRLMTPISSSLRQSDMAKARVLLEKVGQLDKMERDLQRFGTPPDCATPAASPLSRAPLSTTISVDQLRKAIESHVIPTDEAWAHWHMSWKQNRRCLAKHLYAGLKKPEPRAYDGGFVEACPSDNLQTDDSILIGNLAYAGA